MNGIIYIETYISYHPIYNHPVPDNYRFPMQKYALLPQQFLHEDMADPANSRAPSRVSLGALYLAYTPDYVHKFVRLQLSHKEALPIGFVQNQQLVNRELILVQGTIETALWALRTTEVGFNIAGGTHHAFFDRGGESCMLDDQAVAAAYLLAHTAARKVSIIDLDVHQGNGAAEISRHDPHVFTFSMHAEGNYPFVEEQSNRDITLPTGTTDAAYPSILAFVLPRIITAHRSNFVFYQLGVDMLSSDKLGKLSLSVQDYADRNQFIFNLCRQHYLPMQCSMRGGYSPQLSAILKAHTNTFMMSQ